MPTFLKRLWKYWYNMLSKNPDKATYWTFMNYGYRDPDPKIDQAFWQQWSTLDLEDVDAKLYDSARLYYEVCNHQRTSNFKGKDVLEVGSGRGGGAAFITRNFGVDSYTGLDLSNNAVQFCRQRFEPLSNLSFTQGNSEQLPFDDNTFDTILNIESSHCYEHFQRFVNETHRALKPGGHFYFADFRDQAELEQLETSLLKPGFSIEHKQDITANVLASLQHTNEAKKVFLQQHFPKLLQKVFRTFAGLKGTYMYERFERRTMIYMLYVLRKDA